MGLCLPTAEMGFANTVEAGSPSCVAGAVQVGCRPVPLLCRAALWYLPPNFKGSRPLALQLLVLGDLGVGKSFRRHVAHPNLNQNFLGLARYPRGQGGKEGMILVKVGSPCILLVHLLIPQAGCDRPQGLQGRIVLLPCRVVVSSK